MRDGDAGTAASANGAGGPASTQVRQAGGIYGLIVTAAVLATAGTHLHTLPLAVAVFTTLLVYWLAEEYAQLVGRASAGDLPTWSHARSGLAVKWPMVSASYVPLLALLLARLLGVSLSGAAYTALAVTVLMLTFYGWAAGRTSGLTGFVLVVMTSAAGALGLLMVLLKVVIANWH